MNFARQIGSHWNRSQHSEGPMALRMRAALSNAAIRQLPRPMPARQASGVMARIWCIARTALAQWRQGELNRWPERPAITDFVSSNL